MEIKYNITGKARKNFVKAISEITGELSSYLGMPSCAYAIGEDYKVTRDGNLEVSDCAKTNYTAWLMAQLEDRGYTAEPVNEVELIIEGVDEAADQPEGYSIGMHISELSDKPFSEDALEKLNAIVAGKKALFQKSLGTASELKTEWESDTLWFDWFDHLISKEQTNIYSEFFRALYRFAENAKRVNISNKDIENEKFAMRTFLNRIGLSGPEHKALRKELLKNLSGSSAFRYGRPNTADVVTTVCYGKTEKWESREEARKHFFEAICNSEGSERERYINVYTKIMAGKTVCSDDVDE